MHAGLTEAAVEAAAAELLPPAPPRGGSRAASSSSLSAQEEGPQTNGRDRSAAFADMADWPSLNGAPGPPRGEPPSGQAREAQRGGAPGNDSNGICKNPDGSSGPSWPKPERIGAGGMAGEAGGTGDAWPAPEAGGPAGGAPRQQGSSGRCSAEGCGDAAWGDPPDAAAAAGSRFNSESGAGDGWQVPADEVMPAASEQDAPCTHRQSINYQASLFSVGNWRQHAMQQHAPKQFAGVLHPKSDYQLCPYNQYVLSALCGALHL